MQSTATPGLEIEAPHASFADAFQFATVRHAFHFKNTGPREVVIEEGLGLKPGAKVTFSPARIPPGGVGTVEVAQDLRDSLGQSSFRFAIVTDEPGVSRYRMSLSGFVLSAYSPEQSLLRFGRVQRGQAAEKSVELFSRDVDRLEVRRVEGAPEFLRVTATERSGLAGEGLVVRVRLQERPPLGLSTGRLVLWTNVDVQPRIEVAYAVEAFADIEPDVHPLSFELVRMGEPKTVDVRLSSRSGNAFKVKDVTDSLGVMDVEQEPCAGASAEPSNCTLLHVTTRVEGPMDLQGVLTVRFADGQEPLPLSYGGIVISPRTEVRQLDLGSGPSIFSETPSGPRPGAGVEGPAAPSPVPAPASVSPTPAPALSTGAQAGVRLFWRSRNDRELYGYLVYRAEREIGPFRRVSDVIRVGLEPADEHGYEFRDPSAVPSRTYFYYLDTVSRAGKTERFSPVRAHTAPAR